VSDRTGTAGAASLAARGAGTAADARRDRLRQKPAVDEATIPLVFAAFGDDDPSVRKEAVRLVQRSPATPALLLALEKALCDDDLARRSTAMEALSAVGKPALALLTRLSADPRAGVRRLAVDALGMSRLAEATEVLDKVTRDPQPAVRAAALEAVARTGSIRAVPILMRVVEDRTEQASVALAALLGLLQVQKVPSLPALRRHLADPLTASAALRLLGRAGEAQLLAEQLEKVQGARRNAAVLGLAEALEKGRTAPQLKTAAVQGILEELVDEGEVQVACAAIIASAYAGRIDFLAQAAARDDRAHIASTAHRAVAILVRSVLEVGARLRMLAADDAPGADLLLELADAAERASGVPRGAAGADDAPGTLGRRALDDRSFARLARLFESAAGLQLAEDARVRVEARLLPRLDETGCADFARYTELVTKPEGHVELGHALELITVHETYFFRERAQLDCFVQDVVPELARAPKPVRIWSAGSSTGEEAYTLSILLHEAGLAEHEVFGSDIAHGTIETARAGKYTPRSFRGEIEQQIRRRWFIYELGGVHVLPRLKESVRFLQVNLLDDGQTSTLAHFDVIFCRNVLIYLTQQARQRVIEMFFRRLKPGGVLFLGHSESLLNVDTPFALRPLSPGIADEKPSRAGAPPAATNRGGDA
jgi:chemotaxis protein methyltransferase CheR